MAATQETLRKADLELFEGVIGDAPPEAFHEAMVAHDLKRQMVDAQPTWTREEIIAERERFLTSVRYEKLSKPLSPDFDTNSFFTRTKDRITHYRTKHDETVAKTQKDESAEYGVAHFGQQEAVMFVMNYEFFGGSLSEVAGEQFYRAAQHAIEHRLPLVIINSTGGARQHENTSALYAMERLIDSLCVEMRQKAPELPIVNVVLGEVWGGIPASSFPKGDLRIGYTGSRMGFAGNRVISDSEGRTIPSNSQRVEIHALARNLDVLVSDSAELIDYLTSYFAHMHLPDRHNHHPTSDSVHVVPHATDETINRRKLFYEVRPVNRLLSSHAKPDDIRSADAELWPERAYQDIYDKLKQKGLEAEELERQARAELLLSRYQNLLFGAGRVDTEAVLEHGFDSFVPFYNRYYDETNKTLTFPKIIAAIGRIGVQPFLVIGHQPSYKVKPDGTLAKIFALPEPADMRYQRRFINFGAKMKLPLVNLCDTPGALPSLSAEIEGQFEYISDNISLLRGYPAPLISIVTGLQGSGGGLMLTPRGDSLAMLSRGLMTVADPGAATVILYKGSTPQQKADTIVALSPDARGQVRSGILEPGDIIRESDNPYATIEAIRRHIVSTHDELRQLSDRRLMRRRSKRLHDHRAKSGTRVR